MRVPVNTQPDRLEAGLCHRQKNGIDILPDFLADGPWLRALDVHTSELAWGEEGQHMNEIKHGIFVACVVDIDHQRGRFLVITTYSTLDNSYQRKEEHVVSGSIP